jgi:hypothetical protein
MSGLIADSACRELGQKGRTARPDHLDLIALEP